MDCRGCHDADMPTRETMLKHEKLLDSVHTSIEQDGTPRAFQEDYPDCKNCHDNNFIRYYFTHNTTRLHKVRDPCEVVNTCARCHANTAMAQRHNLLDVVSSYMETYHGKAVLFGSSRTPDCLDCHAGQGSIHKMHAKTDQRSSVNSENRAATCTAENCHTSAAPAISSFNVHIKHDMVTNPLLFGVALFFVVMTLAILLPILTLNILSLVRELFPSHEAEQEVKRLEELINNKPALRGGVLRFTGSLRLQHIFLTLNFLVLCLTGFPRTFAKTRWAPVILDLFGGINGAPIVHRIAGVALLIGFAVHIVLIFLNIRSSLAKQGKHGFKSCVKEIMSLPMIPGHQDMKDIVALTKYVCFLSPKRPNYDRFSWKEKLEYLGLFWGIPLLGVTGILLWAVNISSHVLPGWVLNIAYLAHIYESILAAVHITLIHIPGVIGISGSSSFSAMLNGKITPKVQAEEHGREIERWNFAEEVSK
ncbi:MAG: cytochrome b/b6 domain-containing protein [Phycisphaerae bacterium]